MVEFETEVAGVVNPEFTKPGAAAKINSVKTIEQQTQELEAMQTRAALLKHKGNRAAAARELGVDRRWLDRRIELFNLKQFVQSSAGRPILLRMCPICKHRMTTRQLWTHAAECKKAHGILPKPKKKRCRFCQLQFEPDDLVAHTRAVCPKKPARKKRVKKDPPSAIELLAKQYMKMRISAGKPVTPDQAMEWARQQV